MHPITLEDLKQRRLQTLMGSEQAVRRKADTYRILKRLVQDVNARPLDVGDYYQTASRLGSLLLQMACAGDHTIFQYFAEHIDPGRHGDARFFRLECRDLERQLGELERWRTSRRQLKRIK